MAVCSSSCDSEERLVLCADLLLLHGAMVNRHDRYVHPQFSNILYSGYFLGVIFSWFLCLEKLTLYS